MSRSFSIRFIFVLFLSSTSTTKNDQLSIEQKKIISEFSRHEALAYGTTMANRSSK